MHPAFNERKFTIQNITSRQLWRSVYNKKLATQLHLLIIFTAVISGICSKIGFLELFQQACTQIISNVRSYQRKSLKRVDTKISICTPVVFLPLQSALMFLQKIQLG